MRKRTKELRAGDVVFFRGERSTIEMVADDPTSDTWKVRHTLGMGFFREDAEWLVEDAGNVVDGQARRLEW